jgi:hypothetical protein
MCESSVLTTTVSRVRAAIFPLDEQWQVDHRGYSHQLSYQLLWLSSLVPFAQVEQILIDVGQIRVSKTSIWEQTQVHGERLQRAVKTEQKQVSVERTRWFQQRYDPFLTRCVSMDGGMICILGEGWKELKVGLVSHLEPDWTAKQPTVRLKDMKYCAVIGDLKRFEPALWALAVKHDVPYAGRLVVVADGAHWIWRLVADLFPVCTQIVDYYHAKQHLAQASHALYPDDETAAQTWFKQMSECLFRGEIFKIIADLQGQPQSASYFVSHQRRMQYQHVRAEGYPIGSGGVESGIKQFKQRLTGAGMRWSRQGATRMVTLRSAILSGTFHDLWHRAA